jgi:hypothetical protein
VKELEISEDTIKQIQICLINLLHEDNDGIDGIVTDIQCADIILQLLGWSSFVWRLFKNFKPDN